MKSNVKVNLMQGKIDCHGVTDIGRTRETNEDQFLIGALSKSMQIQDTSLSLGHQARLFGGTQGRLLVVADGMGGHAAGERASTLAIDSLVDYLLNTRQWLYRLDEGDGEDLVEDLKAALEYSQTSLSAEAEVIPERHGMGTTLTMAYIIWPRLYVLHVGDSRCYLFRNSKLRQITKDHTMAQEFVDDGTLNPDEAEDSQWSHIVCNVVGGNDERVKPEAHKIELAIGDALLLCTDGLTRHVCNAEIATALDYNLPATDVCDHLVEAANEAGGSDNITVVVARFLEADEVTELVEEEAFVEESPAEEDSPSDTQPLTVDEVRSLTVGNTESKFDQHLFRGERG